MRLLVTGGAGFLGSHFVARVLAADDAGIDVDALTVLDKLTYAGNEANLAPVRDDPRLRFVCGDIGDAGLLAQLVPGHDAVVNFAAETHVDRSIAGPAPFVLTNVLGLQVLLDACRDAKVARVLQISTDEVYGSIDVGSWPESAPLQPSSPYAASKAAGEHLVMAYHRTYGMDVGSVRSCNAYGPRQHPEKLIPRFITRLLDGKSVPLYGDGQHVREWLHVDDVCRAAMLVLAHGEPGASYNIGGGTELTNRELTDRLLVLLDATADRIEPVTDRPGHDRRYSVDATRIRALGWEPLRPFEPGLRETVEWYREHESWWRTLTQRA